MPGRPDFAPVSDCGLFPMLLVREVRGDVGLWWYIQTKTSRPAVVDTWPLRPFLLCMVVYCDTFVSAFQVLIVQLVLRRVVKRGREQCPQFMLRGESVGACMPTWVHLLQCERAGRCRRLCHRFRAGL